jgi:hypothetical protein
MYLEESYSGKKEWTVKTDDPIQIQKAVLFQNFQLPENFSKNFKAEHLLSEAIAETHIDEYRKFLYISSITGQVQTPSKEVDLVWHYHIEHFENYLQASEILFNKPFLHMPSDGSEDDEIKHKQLYENTLNTMEKFFGEVNASCWKSAEVRFSQKFRWVNPTDLSQLCEGDSCEVNLASGSGANSGDSGCGGGGACGGGCGGGC